MKILHAREIYTVIEIIQQTLKTTYEQVSEIEHAVEGIIQLEDSLKGKGGEAIRAFFQNVHKPFLLFHQAFITDYDTILEKIKYLLQSFEPAEDGFIHEIFLENDVANGLDRLERRVTSITSEINNAIHSVQDIVSLPPIQADETIFQINQARQHNRMTIENLHSFDEQATRLLDRILDDLLMMTSFMKEIEAMTQSGQLPISHNSVSKMMTSEAYRKLLGSLVQKVVLEPINTVERDPYGNDNSIIYHVYADGLIVMEADRSGKVHYEVVPEIPEEIRDGAITSPVDRAFEGVIDGTGKALGDTIDGLVSLYKFAEENLQPGHINYIEKSIFAYQLIHDPKKKLGEMKDKVINFPKYMWEGMKNAWNRDVINGDAHSRAEFFSYGLTTIGIGVIGDKGLSRAGQLGNAAKPGHVGKVGSVANKIPPPIPINKGLTPAFATGKVNTIP
ncbi:LXG domain-containing protein [Bacillus aquiflavi]|uniref:LXG domain-containing protein n=1 Tax=Bacillus aquiflavi TaxID=2672567 RepID=UPI001CAA3459|nr:LXG domain-containing protein [Bacillus aquiflavi]UAC49508.1 LXG domain-containing protein [Bacillus aquiflavi]